MSLTDFGGQYEKIDDYLTVSEAAAKLGVAPSTLRNWDRSGKLKAARHPINGYRLYRQADLDELIKQLKSPPIEKGGGG